MVIKRPAICEVCGSSGTQTSDATEGRIKTLCRKHEREAWRPLVSRWRVAEDDAIGGFCIVGEGDVRTPAEGALDVANFVSHDVAAHIVEIHNAALAEAE